MGNGPSIHDCAAQLPNRHRRPQPHLAGRRLRPFRANGFDGNLLRGAGHAYANPDAYAYTYTYPYPNPNAHAHAYTYTNAYSDGDTDAYTDTGADHAARAWLQNTRPAKGGPLLEWADLGFHRHLSQRGVDCHRGERRWFLHR